MDAHADLLRRARSGDGEAFGRLVDPYRRELQLHCYRILGSTQDAEDAVQETLLAAWQGLRAFEERASIRTWLYRVATNRCLNLLRSARRRPPSRPAVTGVEPPEPTRLGEIVWLQPYPDALLDDLGDHSPGPAARYEMREVISLAFITALQVLPPRQRAVLILRDVLDFRASEVAQILDCTQEAVTSALKRARATLAPQLPAQDARQAPPPPGSRAEQRVVARLTEAFENGDVDAIISLLTEDAWVTMPPLPLQYQGRELAATFFRTVAFQPERSYRLVATRANGQPAVAVYLRDPRARVAHANGLIVITLAGDRVSAITRFDNTVLPSFGLPRLLQE